MYRSLSGRVSEGVRMINERFIPEPVNDNAWECPVGIRVVADLFNTSGGEIIARWGQRADGYEPHCCYLTVREAGASKFVGVRRVWITVHIEGVFLPILCEEVWIRQEIPPGSIVCLQEAFMRWGDIGKVPGNPGHLREWSDSDWPVLWDTLEKIIKTEPDYLIVIESDGNSFIARG